MAPRLKIILDDDDSDLLDFVDSNMAQIANINRFRTQGNDNNDNDDDNASTVPTEQIVFNNDDDDNDNFTDEDTVSTDNFEAPAPLYIMVAPFFNGRDQWLQRHNIEYVLQGNAKVYDTRAFSLSDWLDKITIPKSDPTLFLFSDYKEQLLVVQRLSGTISRECFKTKMDDIMKTSCYYTENNEYPIETAQQCGSNLVACVEEIMDQAAQDNESLPILPEDIYLTAYDSLYGYTCDLKCKHLQFDEDGLAFVSYDDEQLLPDTDIPLAFGLFYGYWKDDFVKTALAVAERESRPVHVVVDKMRTKPSDHWNTMHSDFDITGDSMCTTRLIRNMLSRFMRTGEYVGTTQILDGVTGMHYSLTDSFRYFPGGDPSCEERDLSDCFCASLGFARNYDGTVEKLGATVSQTEPEYEFGFEFEFESESEHESLEAVESSIPTTTGPITSYSGRIHLLDDDDDNNVEERPTKRQRSPGSDDAAEI